jgi:hypothetical protein
VVNEWSVDAEVAYLLKINCRDFIIAGDFFLCSGDLTAVFSYVIKKGDEKACSKN